MNKKIFKAYDIRGIYPDEINERDVYAIAQAFCDFIKPSEVVIGSDVRLSSPALKKIATKAVTDLGIKVIDIGIISTDMLYFTVANYNYSGGFSITASHNPREYNGIKFVRDKSMPISSDTGIFSIRDMASKKEITDNNLMGEINESLVFRKDIMPDYIKKIKTFADFSKFRKMKIVANANFGVAGRSLNKILEETDMEIIKMNYEPDGNFPKGRPDPLVPENRQEISDTIIKEKADLGVAWDADADRCFFFTEKGEFIEGYFITALLAKIFLEKNPGANIIRDTRLTWAIDDLVEKIGGKIIGSKAGHAFIKERMRKEDAVFGGEMSAHYYFRDYFYCDNGMIPLVIILEYLSVQNLPLSQIMRSMFWEKYFVSGEINIKVHQVQEIIKKVKNKYSDFKIEITDGVSISGPDWRFSLRGSNTEPLIRLNVEAKTSQLVQQKISDLMKLIKGKVDKK